MFMHLRLSIYKVALKSRGIHRVQFLRLYIFLLLSLHIKYLIKIRPITISNSHVGLQRNIEEWINKSYFNQIDISITNTNKTPLLVHVPCAHKLYRTFHSLYSTYSTVWNTFSSNVQQFYKRTYNQIKKC